MEVKLEVDVHVNWTDSPPIFRFYVDDELLTERYFTLPPDQFYITEHMYCWLDIGVHTLKLENLDPSSTFELKNFKVNNNPANQNLKINEGRNTKGTNGVITKWSFIVDDLLPNHQNNHIDDTESSLILASPLLSEEIERIQTQSKSNPNLALIQRMRDLNNRAAKK